MNGILTSEEETLESCSKLISQAPKMEGLNLSKIVFYEATIFMAKPYGNKF